jgi:hypothetical protein
MFVGNCTDEDATYTIGGPGGDVPVDKGSYRPETDLLKYPHETIYFFVASQGPNAVAQKVIPPRDVSILLEKIGGSSYKAVILERHV